MAEHQEWDELAAGHALDALTPDEEQAFTAHLATCPQCQASVDDHALVAAALGAIATPDEPLEPPSWTSIRDSVVGDPAAERPHLPGSVADVVDLGARRRQHPVSRRLLAAAAAVVVLAAGGIVAWRVTAGSSGGPSSLASCASVSDCHAISLDTASGAAAASLTVHGDTITMIPTNMKPAPAGTEYVLWQQPTDGRPVAVKVFTATGTDAVATARTGVAYADTTLFAVSQERAGPTPASPTTPLLAVGSAT